MGMIIDSERDSSGVLLPKVFARSLETTERHGLRTKGNKRYIVYNDGMCLYVPYLITDGHELLRSPRIVSDAAKTACELPGTRGSPLGLEELCLRTI